MGYPVTYAVLKTPVPFKDKVFPMKNGPSCRVFRDEKSNEIIKLFCRSEKIYLPNVELMTRVARHSSDNE